MEIDFNDLFYAARDAQILWKKRRQHAQGKINLQAGDEGYECEEDECNGASRVTIPYSLNKDFVASVRKATFLFT